jgi:hypothetical protein
MLKRPINSLEISTSLHCNNLTLIVFDSLIVNCIKDTKSQPILIGKKVITDGFIEIPLTYCYIRKHYHAIIPTEKFHQNDCLNFLFKGVDGIFYIDPKFKTILTKEDIYVNIINLCEHKAKVKTKAPSSNTLIKDPILTPILRKSKFIFSPQTSESKTTQASTEKRLQPKRLSFSRLVKYSY